MKLKTLLLFTALMSPGLVLSQAEDSILNDEYIISQEFIQGEVTEVRPAARTITIRGENRGDRRRFTIPENTRITVAGREARLRDLRRGDIVTMAVAKREQRVVVERVRVPDSNTTVEERRANPVVAAESLPATLPKTASNDSLWLIGGLLMLAASGALVFRRRSGLGR